MSSAAPINKTKDWLSQPNVLQFGGANRSASLNTLDNFYVLPMSIPVPYSTSPQTFNTIEHYFQAAKFFGFDNEWADQVRQAKDGKEAQTRGRERRLPREKLDEWKEGASTAAMRVALKHKYVLQPGKEAAEALLETEDKTLVERVTECVRSRSHLGLCADCFSIAILPGTTSS